MGLLGVVVITPANKHLQNIGLGLRCLQRDTDFILFYFIFALCSLSRKKAVEERYTSCFITQKLHCFEILKSLSGLKTRKLFLHRIYSINTMIRIQWIFIFIYFYFLQRWKLFVYQMQSLKWHFQNSHPLSEITLPYQNHWA